jgi:hypothetical protein
MLKDLKKIATAIFYEAVLKNSFYIRANTVCTDVRVTR